MFKALLLLAFPTLVAANNLTISSVTLTNDSTATFNVSWDNSWRVSVAPSNHDAVWIFIKKRECAANQWSHVNLSATVGNHSAGAPLEVYIDGKDMSGTKGIFLRRAADGVGNISNVPVSLQMTGLIPGEYDFRIFGIEMVQIPQGAFQLGDGISVGSLRDGSGTAPFNVTSEGAITVGTGAGQLNSLAAPAPLSLPAAYPKGFKEFYCMKYEISQGQYTDFVNLLTNDQGITRQVVSVASRMNITGTWPVVVANTPHRAIVFMAWADLLAYLDWSALRPMSELEYEKACRGIAAAVGNEKAWGTTLAIDGNTVVNDGTTTENLSNAIPAGNGIANFNNTTLLGPLRCGFAAKTGTNRFESGASYYGVMELSGNVWEAVVSASNATGVAYTGLVGNGDITPTPTPGFADVAAWPSSQASVGSSVSAVGRYARGGSWFDTAAEIQVSDRSFGLPAEGRRLSSLGGRGVR